MVIQNEGMQVEEDIESYLDALKKLYSLLVINNDRQSLQNYTSRDNFLDEKSRFLLKDLLDGAAENVFRTVSEGLDVISLGELLPCDMERAKVKTSYSSKPKVLQVLYKFVIFLYQVIGSIFGLSFLNRSQNTGVGINKQTGEDLKGQVANKRVPDDKIVQSVASVANELLNRKKRCRICRRSSTKQLKFEHGTSSAVETDDINKETTNLQQKHQAGPFRLGRNDSQNLWARRTRETKAMTRWRQLSRYIVNPPNQLNLPKQSMRSSASLSPWNAISRSQKFGKDNEINLRGNALSQADELIERKELGLHKASSVHIKNVKTNVGKVGSMNRTKNSPHQANSVQDLRIPLNSEKKNSLLDRSPGKTNKLILDKNLQKRKFSKAVQSQPSIPAVSARNKQIQTQTKMAATSKVLPHRKTMRQTLPYPVRYRVREEIDRGKVKMKIDKKEKQRLILSDQPKSNSTISHGSSSSSWTTQQGSTSYHEDEEYSVTDPSQSSHHSSTSAGSESEGQYVSSSTQGHNTGSPRYSDSQLSSAPSSTHSLEDSKSDSDSVGYLLSDQTSSLEPSYQQGHYSRRYRPTHRKRPRKRTSSLKKLKDKVAIFFHHHHHHHHHLHNSDDSEKSDDLSQAYHGTALSKRDTKMFKRRNQAETSGEKVTEKLSKSMVHYRPNKKRGSNFNKLVGGLVRHVRHPKKSKISKSSIKHQAKNQHVSKKLAKKVHWWQLLHRRRPRMRMPKKPRIKLGFGTKKSKLKAVPTLKWH
ncbi:hypothetical protein ACET3Z_021897 [Daucus carota]